MAVEFIHLIVAPKEDEQCFNSVICDIVKELMTLTHFITNNFKTVKFHTT